MHKRIGDLEALDQAILFIRYSADRTDGKSPNNMHRIRSILVGTWLI